MTDRILGPLGVKAMENRCLNPETAVRLNVYTATNRDGEVAPDPNGNIIVFPFDEDGVTVGEKYRAAGKKFWQKAGGKRTFFNADALYDPGLYSGELALVITEGELDCITAIDCGFPLAVSVPDGAPAPPKEKKSDDQDDDTSGKFQFMWNNADRLKKIKRFILAVDNDAPGQNLAEELVRRLGAARCSFVTYPEGCKDLNDVLMKHGSDAAAAVLNDSKPYPLKGLYLLADYPDKPEIKTYSTGWPILDTIYTPFAPSFTVVTGLPGSGKSTWLTNLAINMADHHGWKWAIFSPELPVVPHLRNKMRRIYGGADAREMNRQTLTRVDEWIDAHFIFIDHDVASDHDQDLTVEWLEERLYDALMRFGIRGYVMDPWNEIEHSKGRAEQMTDYTNRTLRSLIKFGRRHALAGHMVVHPTKEVGKDGKLRVPTLYDCDGSAAWFNKPDFGIVIHRPDINLDRTEVHLKKVRFEGTGNRGHINLNFNQANSRYEQMGGGYQGGMDV